ncbi:MAG: hypothetical protein P8100_03040 [bacterium]
MKKLIIILITLLLLQSCSKNSEVKVEYLATSAISEYSLYYLDETGTVERITLTPQSAGDEWNFSFIAEKGDMVYLSGRYTDVNSALTLIIKMGGKVYKQGYSQADTRSYSLEI